MMLSVMARSSSRSPDCSAKPTASVHLYTSESEYTGPRCATSLLPASRKKFVIRPFASSSFSIDGMLFSTFVSRRAPQNPCVMVTACTGMLCSLAYGDLSTKSTPSSFQSAVAALAAPPPVAPNKLRTGTELTRAADAAAPTNSRRDNFDLLAILASQEQPVQFPYKGFSSPLWSKRLHILHDKSSTQMHA